jgi:hypothetical protein
MQNYVAKTGITPMSNPMAEGTQLIMVVMTK